MPNHVYSVISLPTLTKKQKGILEKIEEARGLCRYYKPMPKELENTTSPPRIVSQEEYLEQMEKNKTEKFKSYPLTKEMNESLIQKYGHNSWYGWCNQNWDTKWGCYDFIVEDEVIYYTSAWSPIGENIIEMFAKDFPDFVYSWEEEEEYGSELEYDNGECIQENNYDMPEWEEVKELEDGSTITKLINEHPNYEDGIGYYLDWSKEFLGKNLEEIEIN